MLLLAVDMITVTVRYLETGVPKVVTDVLQNVQNAAARRLLGYSCCQSGLQNAMHEK